MNKSESTMLKWTSITAMLMAGTGAVAAPKDLPPLPKLPTHETAVAPSAAEATGAAAAAGTGVVSDMPAAALVPPVTLTYSGHSPVFLVKDGGTNKGVESLITNTQNASSAVYGETGGSGAGVAGYNWGTTGPAGKFYLTNSASAQSTLFATTAGTGSAVFATITNPDSETPVIYGRSLENSMDGGPGYGVEGDGGQAGVYGYSPFGYGVLGTSAERGTGVAGMSHAGYGVVGEDDGPGIGVYGYSATGFAGEFVGKVKIDGSLTVNDMNVSSDRNLKAGLRSLDTRDVLERVRTLPIGTWYYKTDANIRHAGPMAQDFHAAFGLDGEDNTHINVVDAAGISLAAIKELANRVKDQDARLARLEAELKRKDALTAQLLAQMSLLERARTVAAQPAVAIQPPGAHASANR